MLVIAFESLVISSVMNAMSAITKIIAFACPLLTGGTEHASGATSHTICVVNATTGAASQNLIPRKAKEEISCRTVPVGYFAAATTA